MKEVESHVSCEDFFTTAVIKLRDIKRSKGIHSVYSGFNEAFRKYFGLDPVATAQALASEGKIEIRIVRGGAMIYLPGEAPQARKSAADEVLSKIIGGKSEKESQQITLIERIISTVIGDDSKKFPEDFLGVLPKNIEYKEIQISASKLELLPGSSNILVSPGRQFRYAAKNTPEAKFIMYAFGKGDHTVKIPLDNKAIFHATVAYEKYIKNISVKCFDEFVKETNDRDISDYLTKETLKKLGLLILA